MSTPKKWRDAPEVYAPREEADRWLRCLFLQVLEKEFEDCGPSFWRAETSDVWADRWLPGVPWGHALAGELLWAEAKTIRPFVRPGTRALPVVWLGEAEWGTPRKPERRATEKPASFATRWRRWEAAERRRLSSDPTLTPAKPIDPDHLQWVAWKLHGRTYEAVARASAHVRTARELDTRVKIVKRAIKHAAARLQIPAEALRYKKCSP